MEKGMYTNRQAIHIKRAKMEKGMYTSRQAIHIKQGKMEKGMYTNSQVIHINGVKMVKDMTSCGALKEKPHKNLALPGNIFFQKILVYVRFLIFIRKTERTKQ